MFGAHGHNFLTILFPWMLALLMVGGCSGTLERTGNGENESVTPDSIETITQRTWQVEDIDERGIVDRSMTTLEFSDEGRVGGRGGCNRYFGTVEIDGDNMSFSALGSTRMACAPALMDQESRFFAALSDVARFEIDAESFLNLYDAEGVRRVRALAMEAEEPPPADLPTEGDGTAFDCGEAGVASMKFLGPDTIELQFAGATHVLPQAVSASGAKYAADGVTFWNKGGEAMIEVGGVRYACVRQERDE